MDSTSLLIRNHCLWRDTTGQPIDCHEGCILRVGDVFYWYGRSYRGNINGVYGPEGLVYRRGLVCYSSKDLVNWTNEGVCLAYPEEGWVTHGTWHRPRILFNQKTGKYVLWFFCLGRSGTSWWARDVVALSGTPTGPFEIAGEPTISGVPAATGDHALLLDSDGQGYIAKGDWPRNGWVVKLTDDFQNTTGEPTLALRSDPAQERSYEGASIARYKSKCIVAGSGVVGIDHSDTSYAVADVPLGPYRYKGLMSKEKTWRSQISSFFYLAESDCLLALCDQWLVGPQGQRVPAEFSCQLWLPVIFNPATETAEMQYLKQWNPWAGA